MPVSAVHRAGSPVEPSADFLQRAVGAACLAHRRRRRMVVAAGLAASVGMAAIAGAVAYSVLGLAGGWLLTRAAAAVTGSAVSLLMTATTAVEWWSATARAGSLVASVVVMPQGAAMLVAIAFVGAAALYSLRRLLRAELAFRNPGPLCV